MQIVTVNNVKDLEFSALMELLHEIYAKEVPTIDIGRTVDLVQIEKLTTFFANQYAYMAELWGVMLHQVRLLKRTSKNKNTIDEAMDKRDFLEKVISATKLKHYCCSKLLTYHSGGRAQ